MAPARAVLVASQADVLVVDPDDGSVQAGEGLDEQAPTCVAADADGSRAWCGTRDAGVFESRDGGRSWRRTGLDGRRVMSLAVSPVEPGLLWAGTEPSEVWRSGDGGARWERTTPLETLPSSAHWAFPPRPETHHVRWVSCDPSDARRLWVAVEAGALLRTEDGGLTWHDRVPGGPLDTHELAVHPGAPGVLRVAAGDGYFESPDGGATWSKPETGLSVGYLRSVALDPAASDVVVVSGASGPHSAYVAHRADGRVYRREAQGVWEQVTQGWPADPATIAPLLRSGGAAGELWAADERGVHRSTDGGRGWEQVAALPAPVLFLTGLVVLARQNGMDAAGAPPRHRGETSTAT